MTWKDGGNYGLLCREVTNETGRAVCKVWTKQYATPASIEPWPEGKANFCLILKAPVLLEALEAIRDKAEYMAHATRHESWGDWEIVRGLARTAITAVKGEQADDR